jgi:hypothetical protein
MANDFASRFRFIANALAGDGPFRPVVVTDGLGRSTTAGASYLVRYPRESEDKFARRNEIAFYASPLSQACTRFVGYLSTKAPERELPHDLYAAMADDIDGKGNAIDVFLQQFAVNAKARGSMLLLVDMPGLLADSLGDQISARVAPYWTAIAPEQVTDYAVDDDGKFDFIEFSGNWKRPSDGARVSCTWRFDRDGWSAYDREKKPLDAGIHGLGECPVLSFTESGDFPHFGPFSAIADLAKRLFNLDSELDEILRAQTFSLLTMQVPDNTTDAQKLTTAQTAGETIGTSNLVVHSGSTPAFIAPSDGPAMVYLKRIETLRGQINEIGLNVATINQQESGIAMQMRFAAINGELARFASRMQDLELRAWALSAKWLGLDIRPAIAWPHDFNLADVSNELQILADMQASAMPQTVIIEQQKRIVNAQFGFSDPQRLDEMVSAVEDPAHEPALPGNVVPIQDKNAEVRSAIVKALNGS